MEFHILSFILSCLISSNNFVWQPETNWGNIKLIYDISRKTSCRICCKITVKNVLYLHKYRNLKTAWQRRLDATTLQCGSIEIGIIPGTVLNGAWPQYQQVSAVNIAERQSKYHLPDKESWIVWVLAYLVHTVSLGIA